MPPTAVPPTAVPQTWDIQADVVVVGFGAAGACAALEATAVGRDVVVLDRFAGGGATALSGGVIWTGRRSRSSTARSGPGWPNRRRC